MLTSFKTSPFLSFEKKESFKKKVSFQEEPPKRATRRNHRRRLTKIGNPFYGRTHLPSQSHPQRENMHKLLFLPQTILSQINTLDTLDIATVQKLNYNFQAHSQAVITSMAEAAAVQSKEIRKIQRTIKRLRYRRTEEENRQLRAISVSHSQKLISEGAHSEPGAHSNSSIQGLQSPQNGALLPAKSIYDEDSGELFQIHEMEDELSLSLEQGRESTDNSPESPCNFRQYCFTQNNILAPGSKLEYDVFLW